MKLKGWLGVVKRHALNDKPLCSPKQDAAISAGIALSLHEAITLVQALSVSASGVYESHEVSIIRLLEALGGRGRGESGGHPAARDEPFRQDVLYDRREEESREPSGAVQKMPDVHWANEREGDEGRRNYAWDENDRLDAAWRPPQPQPQQQRMMGHEGAFTEISVTSKATAAGKLSGPVLGARQPGSLWQTTNRAIGGINH